MRLKIIYSLTFFFIAIGANAQNGLSNFVNASNLKRANLSVMVKDLETGKVVMDHRAEKNTIPASTTKLVTTATALEILGPDFKFETKLQYDGAIRDSVLNGNIYILGGGDPTLGSAFMGDSLFLDKWVLAVKTLGIKKINGSVIGDATLFNTEGIVPKWSWEDMGNYYAAGAYGISIYDNTCRVYFKSGAVGSTPEVVRTQPEIPGLKFKVFMKATATDEDSAYFYGEPLSNERLVYGGIPANKSEFLSKADIPNPPLYAAQVLAQKLKDNGVDQTKSPSAEISDAKVRTTIFTLQSPPLKDIIANINYKSNNHYAEHVFRYLSLQRATQAAATQSVPVIKDFWKKQGVDVNGLIMFDGCGLAPNNAISANFFVDLLEYEYKKSQYKEVFLASLPVAGQSGTIRKLLKGTRLEGKVQAKSGSIYGVQCFAGYINWNNKVYAFAVLVNNYSGIRKNAVEEIEKLLLSVAK